MDETKQTPETQPNQQQANSQAMDVVAPPPQEQAPAGEPQQQSEALPTEEHPTEASHDAPEHPAEHHQEHHGNGANAAIVATVLIVIALSAMAVFAYIKTNAK